MQFRLQKTEKQQNSYEDNLALCIRYLVREINDRKVHHN